MFLDGQGRLLDIKIVKLVGLVVSVVNRYVVDGHFHNRPDNFRFFVANAVPDMEVLEKRVGEYPTRAVIGAVNIAFALVVLDDFPGAPCPCFTPASGRSSTSLNVFTKSSGPADHS